MIAWGMTRKARGRDLENYSEKFSRKPVIVYQTLQLTFQMSRYLTIQQRCQSLYKLVLSSQPIEVHEKES